VSVFADHTWVADNRPAQVTGTVAPGQTYKFTFDLDATKVGTFDEFFGVVEDGVAWFSDPGQGGPPDNDLEVKITVVAGPDAGTHDDAGTTHAGDAGAHEDAGTHEGDAGDPKDDAGEPPVGGDDAGPIVDGTEAGTGDGGGGNGSSSSGSSGGGCSVGAASGATPPWSPGVGLLLAGAGVAAARRRRGRGCQRAAHAAPMPTCLRRLA